MQFADHRDSPPTDGEQQAHSCQCDAWKGALTGYGVGPDDRSSSTASLPSGRLP